MIPDRIASFASLKATRVSSGTEVRITFIIPKTDLSGGIRVIAIYAQQLATRCLYKGDHASPSMIAIRLRVPSAAAINQTRQVRVT